MTSAALRKILDHDIPELPPHWHDVCQCILTVAYIRVSKIGKRTKIVSPTIQLNEIIEDAKRNNRRIVKILFDINKSGREFDREAFGTALADIKAGDYKHVSVWKWSRFGRTLRGSIMMLAALEEIDGIVDSASEPYDHDSVFGEFSRDQMLLIADLQSKVIGETWRSVHETRRENKLPHSGQKRFGYDYRDEDERNRRYELNEEEANFLREAYQRYVNGQGMNSIAADANARGLVSPLGNPWTQQAFTKMMDNGFASGQMRSRSKAMLKATKRKPTGKRESYDVWSEGSHPAIIDRELWEAYQKVRESHATLPPRLVRGAHELSGLIVCGICGRRLTFKRVGQQLQPRWLCPGRMAHHPDRPVSISDEEALRVVRRWVTTKSQPEWIDQEARRVYEERQSVQPEGDRIAADLKKVESQAAKALDLYLKIDDTDGATATRVLATLNALEKRVKELKGLAASLSVDVAQPDWKALGVIAEGWDIFPAETHNAALRGAVGMLLITPKSAPRVRTWTVPPRVVPLWEMDEWSDWLSARRRRSA